jgi:hypothetical protein
MNIAIVGSRSWEDYDRIETEFFQYLKSQDIEVSSVTIVSGGAKGADTCAEKLAKARGIPFIKLKPDYQRYGSPVAQFVRNEEIVKISDHILAFSNGTNGTKHVISVAKAYKRNLKVYT